MFKMNSEYKRLFSLLFAVYLLCSVFAVAFDYDRATPSKTCAICFMNNSLSSAVSETPVTPEIDLRKEYLSLGEEISPFNGSAISSGLSYRGPPLP